MNKLKFGQNKDFLMYFVTIFSVFILTSFYIPYSAFGLECNNCFWNIHYLSIFLVFIFSFFSVFRGDKWFYKNFILIFSIHFYYLFSVIWSDNPYILELVSVNFLSLILFIFFYWVFSDKCRTSLVFYMSKVVYFLSMMLFILFYGAGNYRFFGGVAKINPAFVGFLSGFFALVWISEMNLKDSVGYKVFNYLSIVLSLAVILLTQSRLVLLSLVLVCLFYFIFVFGKNLRYLRFKRINNKNFILLLFTLTIVPVALVVLFSNFELHRVNALLSFLSSDGASAQVSAGDVDAGRSEIWKVGLSGFSNYWFGHGIGSFRQLVGLSAHNSYILLLYELGFLGFSFFCGILIYWLRNIVLIKSLPVLVVFLYVFFYSFGNDSYFMPVFWVMVAYIVSVKSRMNQ